MVLSEITQKSNEHPVKTHNIYSIQQHVAEVRMLHKKTLAREMFRYLYIYDKQTINYVFQFQDEFWPRVLFIALNHKLSLVARHL